MIDFIYTVFIKGDNEVPDLSWINVGIAALFLIVNGRYKRGNIKEGGLKKNTRRHYIIVSWSKTREIIIDKFNTMCCAVNSYGENIRKCI